MIYYASLSRHNRGKCNKTVLQNCFLSIPLKETKHKFPILRDVLSVCIQLSIFPLNIVLRFTLKSVFIFCMQSHMPTNWQKIEEKVSVAPTYPLSVMLFHMVAICFQWLLFYHSQNRPSGPPLLASAPQDIVNRHPYINVKSDILITGVHGSP